MGYKSIIGLALLAVGVALELLGYTDLAQELKQIAETLIGNMEGPTE